MDTGPLSDELTTVECPLGGHSTLFRLRQGLGRFFGPHPAEKRLGLFLIELREWSGKLRFAGALGKPAHLLLREVEHDLGS